MGKFKDMALEEMENPNEQDIEENMEHGQPEEIEEHYDWDNWDGVPCDLENG